MCTRNCKFRAESYKGNKLKYCNFLFETGKSRLVTMRKMLEETLQTPEERMSKEQSRLNTLLREVENAAGQSLQRPVDTRDPVMRAVLRAYCPCYEPERPGEKKEQDCIWTLDGLYLPRRRKEPEEEKQQEKPKRLKAYEREYVPPAPEEELMRLYEKGLTDRQIAEATGCRVAAVFEWRDVRGLETKNRDRMKKSDDNQLAALYGQGLKDADIAAKSGLSKTSVVYWRKKNGLPANCTKGRKKIGKEAGDNHGANTETGGAADHAVPAVL